MAAAKWGVFDATKYPVLAELSEKQKGIFGLRHVTTHFQKNLGALAGVVESMDHGGEFDKAASTQALRKIIVNALQFAHLSGIQPQEIEKDIEEWQNSTH